MSNASIPFVDLEAAHRPLEHELVEAFRAALRSSQFIGGPEVELFEQEFAAYCGSQCCVGVSSGTDALRFALMAWNVGRGDAVLTVAHTFVATVEAIGQAGAETEFVDIDQRTYTMSPEAVREYLARCDTDRLTGRPLGRRTGKPIKALVPVHLYGQMADMDRLLEIAQEYRLLVIEDACQAHGAGYHSSSGVWRRAGSIGHAAAFSFYPGKNLGALGEAGAVTTDDEQVARTIRMLRDHGQVTKYFHDVEGYNGRLDAVQAAFLRIKLRRLDTWNQQRRAAALCYNELLRAAEISAAIVPPFEAPYSRSVFHLYVVRASGRDSLAAALRAEGIHTGLHYPVPLHLQRCYRDWGYGAGAFPVTEAVAAEILSLPLYPGLTSDQQQRIVAAIDAHIGAAIEQ